jgi:mitochondrial transcription factor 1
VKVLGTRSVARWDAFTDLSEKGYMNDIGTVPWTEGVSLKVRSNQTLIFVPVHPHLHFISHLPTATMSEQLISQFLRAIPERSWLFKYGRMPMSYILSDHVWQVRATPNQLSGQWTITTFSVSWHHQLA